MTSETTDFETKMNIVLKERELELNREHMNVIKLKMELDKILEQNKKNAEHKVSYVIVK